MKECPRSKLVRYLKSLEKQEHSANTFEDTLKKIYIAGMWETYFFYYPSAFNYAKGSTWNPEAARTWGKYFGKKLT